MKLFRRLSVDLPLFYLELHSSQPEEMVEFYARTLSLKFTAATYPFPHYSASLGRVALIISKSAKDETGAESEPGKVTLGVMASGDTLQRGQPYFLPPERPLGRAYPGPYASRLKDPDGHYLALTSSMERVIGRVPAIMWIGDLVACTRDYVYFVLAGIRNRVRHRLSDIVDNWEFATNRVTFVRRNVEGFTHVVASREGLYVVNSHSYKCVLRGAFYGTTVKDGALYCFQSCGWELENKGRILKITLTPGYDQITKVEVIATGLDDGCHQMDFIGEDLLVVDCYYGRILQFAPGKSGYVAHYPLGQISRTVARREYHMNSLAGHPDGTLWVLLHNHDKKPSEVLVLNRKFEPIRRFAVSAGSAHNIVFTNDEHEYLIGDSSGARIISARGAIARIDMMRPRGVSLDEETCVVGGSFFSTRVFRRYVPGRIYFFDRASWTCHSCLSLPAAPTEIRRLDGKDFSISNYVIAQSQLTRSVAAAPRRAVGMANRFGAGD